MLYGRFDLVIIDDQILSSNVLIERFVAAYKFNRLLQLQIAEQTFMACWSDTEENSFI